MDQGRAEMLSYKGEPTVSALPVVSRLEQIVRRGGTIGSPGTLRGAGMSIEDVSVNECDKRWLRKLAEEHTQSGKIWVHEETAWARSAREAKRQKKL